MPPKKKPKKERAAKAPKATPKKEQFDTARNASEVCKNFSLGKCKDPCPFGRIHQGGVAPDDSSKGAGKGAHVKKQQ